MVEHALDWVGGQWKNSESKGWRGKRALRVCGGGPEIGGVLQQAMDALEPGFVSLSPDWAYRLLQPHLCPP